MPTTSFSFSARLVNFPAEMFNDTIFFLEEAKKYDAGEENDWLRWRYLRASIIYSYASLESFVNLLIADTLRGVFGLRQAAEEFQKDRSIGLYAKIGKIYPNIVGKTIDPNWSSYSNFDLINEIRNRLSHYKGGAAIYNDSDPYGVKVTNAEKGVQMVSTVVRILKGLTNEAYPPWVDQQKSKIIR